MEDVTAAAADSTLNGGKSSILIVEDDPAAANLLALVLRRAGYATTVCHDGTAALRHARDNAPSAAVVDIHLPDLSGLILTQKLRQQLGARVPIIVMSGDTSMETLNSLSHVGASYFLGKPVNPAILLQQLGDRLLDSGRRAS